MTPIQQKQIVKGAALFAFGAFYAGYAAVKLEIGAPNNPGAGMFPLLVGCALVAFGVLFVGLALLQARVNIGMHERLSGRPWYQVDIRALAAVLGAIAAFALTVAYFGVAPAIVVMTVVAALGNRKVTPFLVLLLSASYVAIAWLVFVIGLQLPLMLWKWPF